MTFSLHDSVNSSPTNTFATFQAEYSIYHPTLSEGNTKITVGSGNTHQHIIGSMTFEQGKIYYFEVATPTTSDDSQNFGIVGITKMLAAEHTSDSQNRSLFQNIPYPKIAFECRSGLIIDQTTIQDWGSSTNFTDDATTNLALSNFTTDSDKFIRDGSQGTTSNANRVNTSQANTLANAAAGSITPTSGNGYIPSWRHSGNKVFGVLLNFTASDYGSISFTVDGTNWSTPFTKIKLNTGISWTLGVGGYGSDEWRVNCGDDPTFAGLVSSSGNAPANGIGSFYYNISSTNAVSLCTSNLPDPAIDPNKDDLPEDFFKCVTYQGAGSSAKTINLGFNPDLLWFKQRTDTSTAHRIMNTVRGLDRYLASSSTDKDYSTNYLDLNTSNNDITLHGSTGTAVNAASKNFIVWGWKAGGNSNTFNIDGTGYSSYDSLQSDNSANSSLPASSTSGMITPSGMSIGTKQGFSIVKYSGNSTSGAKVPHGLSGLDFLIVKAIINGNSGDTNWRVYHKSLGATKNLKLNSTAAAETDTSRWNDTEPTSTVFSLGNHASTNATDYTYIAYCFTSIEGFSAFGSYTGNGSADGPFVYTGFKPAWVMVKNTTITSTFSSWVIYDNARTPNNPTAEPLHANSSVEEGKRTTGTSFSVADSSLDFLSNGFKPRTVYLELNSSNDTFVYMAFSEMPFKFSATNAR